jgi:hypothetical protein
MPSEAKEFAKTGLALSWFSPLMVREPIAGASSPDVSTMLAGLVRAGQGARWHARPAKPRSQRKCSMKNAFTLPVTASMFRATKNSKGRTP